MESRGSVGQKRARTERSAAGEGDWTCPKCGNVNFSFRTTCNLRNCGASKPVDVEQQGIRGTTFYPPAYGPTSAGLYMGAPGTHAGIPLAVPSNYGAAVPIAQGPYNFGVPVNAPAVYNPMAVTASYGPGVAVGGGPAYGASPLVDGYGMPINMGKAPQMAGHRSGVYPKENGVRKRRGGLDGSSEGDWICPKCGNVNFAFRATCNMRQCGTSKPKEISHTGNGPFSKSSDAPNPVGSWKCKQCGNVNYPFRTKCNRKNCGADQPSDAKTSP